MRKALTMLLAAGMIWTIGCGAPKADTPQQAMKNLKTSIEGGDKDLFMATVAVQDDQKPMIEAMFKVLHEAVALDEALKKQYGKDASMKGGPSGELKFEGLDDQANYKVEGDKATFKPKGGGEKIDMVKKDGAWKVEIPDVPKGKQAEQFLKVAPAMAEAFAAGRAKVGKEGYTAEKISEEVGQDIFKAMMGGMGDAMKKGMEDATKEAKE